MLQAQCNVGILAVADTGVRKYHHSDIIMMYMIYLSHDAVRTLHNSINRVTLRSTT